MYPKLFDSEPTTLEVVPQLNKSEIMYPKQFDGDPLTLGEAKLAQKLNRLTVDEDNGASDAGSSTAVENQEAETKVTKKRKKNKNRKNRRGGMKKKPKKVTAIDSSAQVHTDHSAEGDIDSSDDSDSDASTVVMSPRFGDIEPLHKADSLYSGPEVPVLPHYETSIISSAFDKDTRPIEGQFATCDITEGTRLICEAPLITLPSPGDDIPTLMEAYKALPPADQDLIWSLPPGDHEQLTAWSTSCDALIARVTELRDIKPENQTKQDSEEIDFLQGKINYMCHAFRIAARFFTHRNSLTDVLESHREYIHPNIPVTGFFATAAKLRHSCVPNCFGKWNPVSGRFTVHAVKFIPAGEELTVSLIAEKAFYYPFQERQTKLKEHSGIVCTCPACDPKHGEYRMHEQTRTQLQVLVTNLAHELSALQVHEDSSSARKVPLDPTALASTEQRLHETIALLQQAGCADHEIVRWRIALRDQVLPKREALFAALAQAKLAVGWARICYGEDHPDMLGLKTHADIWETLVEQKKREMKEKGKDREEAERLKKEILKMANIVGKKDTEGTE
jgi:hypothetical protein